MTLEAGKELDRRCVWNWLNDVYRNPTVAFNTYSDEQQIEFAHDALDALKEQEPKIGHWIFESQYCEAWSHTCSECGKRMTTAVNTFANWCWNCGAKMTTGGERG